MTPTENLEQARTHLVEAIAFTVRNDLANDGELVTAGMGTNGGTLDVLYRLHWALDALDEATAAGRQLRSA